MINIKLKDTNITINCSTPDELYGLYSNLGHKYVFEINGVELRMIGRSGNDYFRGYTKSYFERTFFGWRLFKDEKPQDGQIIDALIGDKIITMKYNEIEDDYILVIEDPIMFDYAQAMLDGCIDIWRPNWKKDITND